jgi:hypothetical protein
MFDFGAVDPTNRFTSSMFHPPQRGLPRFAIRDFLGEGTRLAARFAAPPLTLSPNGWHQISLLLPTATLNTSVAGVLLSSSSIHAVSSIDYPMLSPWLMNFFLQIHASRIRNFRTATERGTKLPALTSNQLQNVSWDSQS